MIDIYPSLYTYLLRLDTLDQNTIKERNNVLELVGSRLNENKLGFHSVIQLTATIRFTYHV